MVSRGQASIQKQIFEAEHATPDDLDLGVVGGQVTTQSGPNSGCGSGQDLRKAHLRHDVFVIPHRRIQLVRSSLQMQIKRVWLGASLIRVRWLAPQCVDQ